MADRSQNPPNNLTVDDLNALIVSAKIEQEMSELQARFPAHLAAPVSRIRVRQPKETSVLSEKRGASGSSFRISKSTVYLSVLRNSENEEPVTKDLTLTCANWQIFHYYLTGSAGSGTISVSVNYGDMSAKAYVTEYDDPGVTMAEWSHGRIGKVLKALLEDLAAGDSAPSEVELIDMLLGDDTKAHLDAKVEGYGPLREVIDKKLKDSKRSSWYVSFRLFFQKFTINSSHTPYVGTGADIHLALSCARLTRCRRQWRITIL